MKPHFAILACVTLACSVSPAVAEDWKELPGSDQWTLREQGEMFSQGYSFFAVSQSGGATLELGCSNSRTLHLVFTPPEGTKTPLLTTVGYAVNGTPAAYDSGSGGGAASSFSAVHSNAESGAASDLVWAIADAWQGRITVSLHEGWTQPPETPASFTQDFEFNEDETGGMSEMILAGCGLL